MPRRKTGRLITTRLSAAEAIDVKAAIDEAGIAKRTAVDLAYGRGMVYALVGKKSYVISTQEKWAEFQLEHMTNKGKD